MKRILFEDLPVEDRAQALKDNCDKAEDISYFKKFSPEELKEMKDELSDLSIKINDLEIKKKELTKQVQMEIDPKKKDVKLILGNLKQKAQYVNEECFKFIDHEDGRVGYYNDRGDLIEERPILPEERQKSIFPLAKAQ